MGLDSNESFVNAFDINVIPTLLFFNPEGRLLSQMVGYTDFNELNDTIIEYIPFSTLTGIGHAKMTESTTESSNQLTVGNNEIYVVLSFAFSFILMTEISRRKKSRFDQ